MKHYLFKFSIFLLFLIMFLPIVSAQATVSITPYPLSITAAQNISIIISPGTEGVGNSVNIEQNGQVITSLGTMCAESKCFNTKTFIFYVPSNWQGTYSVAYTEYIKEAGNIVARPAKSDFTVYPKGALDISKIKETLAKTTGAGSNAFSFYKQFIVGSKRISFNIEDKYKEEFYNQIKEQLSENVQFISDINEENSFVLNIEQPENQVTELVLSNEIIDGSPNFNMEISAYKGYIIEFKEKPLFVQKTDTENKIITEKAKIAKMSFINPIKYIKQIQVSGMENNVETNFIDYKNSLLKSHQDFRKKLENKGIGITGNVINSKASEKKILSEYTKVFNGIAMDVSAKDIEKIRKMKEVKAVYKNEQVKTTLTESVPQINADDVWNSGYTGKGITIAIIDTGIDYTHPDLGGCLGENCKVIGGYDFVNYDNNPMDDQGHGTHCAGIAAGNGTLKGVAPDAKLLAYKVLDSEGSGYDNNIIDAIEMSMDPNNDNDNSDHADVISLSLGGSGNPDDSLSLAVDNAVDAGVVAVVAAGNSGPNSNTIDSPGTSRKAITVGAVNKSDKIARFSSRGPVEWNGKTLTKPDVVAPGVKICAAEYDSAWDDERCLDDEHIAISGTSMATPHVAGAAALLLEAHPYWTPEDVKSALMLSAKDLGYDANTQGAGRIDVLAAKNIGVLISPTILDFGNLDKETQKSEIITITNGGETGKTLSLNASSATKCIGCSGYSVISFNVSSLTLGAGESADIAVNLNIPGDLKGYFSGELSIAEIGGNGKISRIPFYFAISSFLIISVVDKEGKPLTPSVIALHNADFTFVERAYQSSDFNGNNITFGLKEDNYTIYALGDDANWSLDYSLMKTVDVSLNKEIVLNLKDATPFTIKAESKDGKKLELFEWDRGIYSGFKTPFTISLAYSGFGFYGDRIEYISNHPSENFDTDVILSYSGVPARINKKWDLGSFEWPSMDERKYMEETYSTAEEQYLAGFVLHNVDEKTGTTISYSKDKLANYTYNYNFPAMSPNDGRWAYLNALTWILPQPYYGYIYYGGSYSPIAVPLKRVYYVFGDNPAKERYYPSWSDWSFTNFIYSNYIKSDDWLWQIYFDDSQQEHYKSEGGVSSRIIPVPGYKEEIYFGTAPYLPVQIKVSISGNDDESHLLRGYGGKAYIKRNLVHLLGENYVFPSPTYKVYKDSILEKTGKLIDYWGWWDYSSLGYFIDEEMEENHNYMIEMEIPSGYPLWNSTKITANLKEEVIDRVVYGGNPPAIERLEISPRFLAGENLPIEISFFPKSYSPEDQSPVYDIQELKIYYSGENKEWRAVEAVAKPGESIPLYEYECALSEVEACIYEKNLYQWTKKNDVETCGDCPPGYDFISCEEKDNSLTRRAECGKGMLGWNWEKRYGEWITKPIEEWNCGSACPADYEATGDCSEKQDSLLGLHTDYAYLLSNFNQKLLAEGLSEFFGGIGSAIGSFVKGIGDGLTSLYNGFASGLEDFKHGNWLGCIFKIVDGIVEAVGNIIAGIIYAISDIVSDTLCNGIAVPLGISNTENCNNLGGALDSWGDWVDNALDVVVTEKYLSPICRHGEEISEDYPCGEEGSKSENGKIIGKATRWKNDIIWPYKIVNQPTAKTVCIRFPSCSHNSFLSSAKCGEVSSTAYTASIPTTGLNVVNLKIYAKNARGENITYEMMPVSLSAREISLNAKKSGDIIYGNCTDNKGIACGGLRLEFLDANKKVIDVGMTDFDGSFNYNLTVNPPLSSIEYIRTGATGIYLTKEEKVQNL